MKKSLTIEDLKNRVGKPVFVIATKDEFKHRTAWHIMHRINTFKAGNESCRYIEFTDGNCVEFGTVHFFRFFDTEVSEEELKEILDAEEKKKKTGYERVREGEKYWNIRGGSFLDDDDFFNVLYLSGDYLNDEKLASNIARAEQLKYKLRRYAALNGGIPSKEDWEDCEIFKYFVVCNYRKNEIYATYISTQRDSFQIYFKDIKACKKAIEIFKKELIWYFTEFQEMLY